jgi:erythromycin esterase
LITDLEARFDSLRRTYLERSNVTRYEFARQHLHVAGRLDLQLRAVAALMSGDASACEGNIRDATMAGTIEWILRREKRIVLLAHNGHIQKTPIATPTGKTAAVDTVGVHLAARLGDQYLAIGTTCGKGDMVAMRTIAGPDNSYEAQLYIRELPPAEPDTLDAILDARVSQPTLIDLRCLDTQTAAAIDAASKMRSQDMFLPINARHAFDMLVHVPSISLWTSSTNASLPDERQKAL